MRSGIFTPHDQHLHPRPSQRYHYEKMLFNHAYWYLVPRGVV